MPATTAAECGSGLHRDVCCLLLVAGFEVLGVVEAYDDGPGGGLVAWVDVAGEMLLRDEQSWAS